MAVLSEARHAGEFILSEADGKRSRDAITIQSGQGVFSPGAVLAMIAAGSAASAAKSGGNTGNGALTLDATTPVQDGALPGIYTVRCITAAVNGGTFRVENPDGDVIGDVAVGATFNDDIKFAIADGATDFIVGDGFDITVNPVAGKYVKASATQKAEAIAIYGGDATSADVKVAGIVRDAEVNGNCLVYDTSIDDATKTARKVSELALAGIIVR